jgi:arylsulfatase
MDKYREVYKNGWDEIREKRYKRQLEAGLIDKSRPLSPPDRNGEKWDELTSEQKAVELEGMAAYAAVVEHMDTQIGRVVETLKQQNVLDNTLILFLSDNGGCAEGGDFISNAKPKQPIGAPESFVRYGKFWANVSNTPYRRYKHYIEQGGISTPLIAHWPDQINGSRTNTFCRHMGHVIDLMATCADLAGTEYPETFKNKPIVPLQGKSLRPLLLGDDRPIHKTLYWEHEGHRAIRIGQWKLVGDIGKNNWQLFDLEHDGTELNDVAAQYPEKVNAMAADWQAWAERSYVLPHYKDRKTQ